MKSKIVIVVLFLVSRLSDLLSTYYSEGVALKNETSLIVSRFDFGWDGLILYNVVVSLSISLLVFFNFKRRFLDVESKILNNESFSYYLSMLFFNKRVSLVEILTSSNFRMVVFFHVFFYAVPLALIVMGFLASIHNIMVANGISLLYSIKPYYVNFVTIFVLLILLVMIQLCYLYHRYKSVKVWR